MWLECIGVVSGCCCKKVYIDIYPHNNYYLSLYSTCISSFFGSSIPTSFVHFLNRINVLNSIKFNY